MNRQLAGKAAGEASEASPLSLLVHAADSQRGKGGQAKPGEGGGREQEAGARLPDAAGSSTFEEQLAQRQAAARGEALHQQALLAQLRGGVGGAFGGGGEGDYFSQNPLVAAQQHHQQAAALALANDIRTAVAAAQLRQASHMQNQDLLLARSAALQQLGALGAGAPGVDQLQQELELHRLEELERRQLLAAASAGAPGLSGLTARQQLEIQEAHMRQEQLDRMTGNESLLERARADSAPAPPPAASRQSTATEGASKDSFQKTPGSVVVPCRARGMPMDHNFKTAYFVIPENVEHGEELICSYFACRNAGIKFRYCTHCKVPVAKRNFRKRHKHGKSSGGGEGDDDEDAEEEEETPIKTKKSMVERALADRKAMPTLPPAVKAAAAAAASISHALKAPKPGMPGDAVGTPGVPLVSHQTRPNISVERERLWGQLLAKRPPTKDGEAVSAWLMEVLSVSDLETPLKENGQVQQTAGMKLPFKAAEVASKLVSKAYQPAAKADEKEESKETPSTSVVQKKKRPLSMLEKEDDHDSDEDMEEEGGDEDGEEGGAPAAAAAAAAGAPAEGASAPGSSDSGSDEAAAKKSKKDVGSFAEWKDRKKHKGLPKKGFSMQSPE